ncbi:MAG: copper amine oxidase N-terminal domain-containing protein, partial [Candidatus Eremiobacteraeota bacterium]|nr:copper amine oxidase N-terminal domain-containing protein [Candidatus Eremiobacteraeota bacterium]
MKHLLLVVVVAVAFGVCGMTPGLAAYPTPAPTGPTPMGTPMAPAPTTPPAAPMAPAAPAMEFGSPPSGEIPILFNDHHVYARPDTLRQGRVLAALVKSGTLLVPLRSMFEQMGATVSYDAASKSVKASKPGSEVQVTLGKSEVVINGESRPLDVPPMMYKGVLLVPVRVISEALGAYVQWVPTQRVAVVRYLPPTPVPTQAPVATPVPTTAPTPAPKAPHYVAFVQGGVTYGRVSNEYAAGGQSKGASWVAAGAYLFDKWAVKADWRQDTYVSSNNAPIAGAPFTMFTTINGGTSTVPQFTARQSTLDGRLEYE